LPVKNTSYMHCFIVCSLGYLVSIIILVKDYANLASVLYKAFLILAYVMLI